MRKILLAAGTAMTLMAGSAHATVVADATGDFLGTFVGGHDADLDVTSFSATYSSATQSFELAATLAGAINPALPGLYVIGVNTGTGVGRPFAALGQPNVIFNQAIVVRKNGTVAIGANSLTAAILGNSFRLSVPLSMLPSTGFGPLQYGFNLWPRNGLGNNNQISDFSPENATITGVPEPMTWALMVGGFAWLGGALRRRGVQATA